MGRDHEHGRARGRSPVAVRSLGLASPLGLGLGDSWLGWLRLQAALGEEAGATALVDQTEWPTAGFPRPDAGLVPGFRPRKQLPDRKAVKLMSREAQLLLFAALDAAGGTDAAGGAGVEPERFGAFAAAGYEVSSVGDVEAMMAASRGDGDAGHGGARPLDLERLFGEGRHLYNPLSPLKVLPNMGLFHVASALGLRGPHLSVGSSPAAGLMALGEAVEALVAGHCDAALALASDAQTEVFRAHLLVDLGVIPRLAPAEAAAALLLVRHGDGDGDGDGDDGDGDGDGSGQAPSDPGDDGVPIGILAWAGGQERPVSQEPATAAGRVGDGGAARARLYQSVVDDAGGDIDACFCDLWGPGESNANEDPVDDHDDGEHIALAQVLGGGGPFPSLFATRPLLGYAGAAAGLLDVALACCLVRSGQAKRVLVTASGLAGDLAAVVVGQLENAS